MLLQSIKCLSQKSTHSKLMGRSQPVAGFGEAVNVWLGHWSGQLQHEMAADYRINAGGVSDVLKERTHLGFRRQPNPTPGLLAYLRGDQDTKPKAIGHAARGVSNRE